MPKTDSLIKEGYLKLFGAFRLNALISGEIENDWTILDVGCGKRSPLADIRKGKRRVGLDMFEPYIAQSRELGIHDEYVIGDVRHLPFGPGSFDCVISTDVLEHLNKEDGAQMLAEMERVAKRKVILTTPNGFLPTYAGPKDNPDESHLSGWTCKEFEERGFEVRGFSGLKQLWTVREGLAVPKLPVPVLASVLVDMSQFCFAQFCPSAAFHLFVCKKIKRSVS